MLNYLASSFSRYLINFIIPSKAIEPMPSPIDKIQNRFRWRIIIKGIMTENANRILNEYLQKFYNCNYKNTKVTIEINPNNMM